MLLSFWKINPFYILKIVYALFDPDFCNNNNILLFQNKTKP